MYQEATLWTNIGRTRCHHHALADFRPTNAAHEREDLQQHTISTV